MIRIALAQVNPTIGDLQGNALLVRKGIADAKSVGANLVAFPEMAITGYPPDDLLLRRSFLRDSDLALASVVESTQGICAVVGCVQSDNGALFNAAALVCNGDICGYYRKHHLPNYGVFDERRFFTSGDEILLGELSGHLFGLTICEDLWLDDGPHAACAAAGAGLVININASPYHLGKGILRQDLLTRRARHHGVAIAYVNCVGGADEVIFDGQSCAVDAGGTLIARAAQFCEELLVFDWDPDSQAEPAGSAAAVDEAISVIDLGRSSPAQPPLRTRLASALSEEAEAYAALTLGIRDYMSKNHFNEALVGISGGIDSALTAAIAVDAIGASNVLGISNPSEFTSSQSTDDAELLAGNLGFTLLTLPIDNAHEALRTLLTGAFPGADKGITDQNLQARIRGTLWMGVSNFTGRLVLSTGNKSEMAVGYATLYGDMAGGFAVLKDVPKTLVYRLAEWRNTQGNAIPASIIQRPPTAELAADQLDTDSLPPYEILDPVLKAYVEDDLGIDEIAALGYNRDLVKRIAGMVDGAEYKRRQSAPGIKITSRAFGRDRRLPITNLYRSQ